MSKTVRKPRSRAKPASSVPPFLHKIYEILENPCHQDLVSWNQEGNAFIIKNVTEFTENVLPKYFKHNNFASFVRQLNLYDFHKSRYENNGSEFYHKLFKKNEKHFLSEIKRKMPNENCGNDSPSLFLCTPEDLGAENLPPPNYQYSSSFQDLVNRQDKLENAMKIVAEQNKQLIKENKMLWNEVSNLKAKQMNTEKATRTLNGQNTQLMQKNSFLWSEMIMNRERYERKVEKLMLFLISSLQGANVSQLFKKKNVAPRGSNAEEESSFENMRMTNTENNNFSVLPVKQMIKHLGKKGGKSQLDKLLERFEEDNLHFFTNKTLSLEEKDFLVKLSSLFEVDTGNGGLSGLDFLSEKRPPQINRSFEDENPREGSSKLCKLEYEDQTPAVLRATEDRNRNDFSGFAKPADKIKEDKMMEIGSPIPIEDEFEMLSFHKKDNAMEYDFLNLDKHSVVSFNRNNSLLHNHFSEDEGEFEEEEVKKDNSFISNKSLQKSRSTSLLDLHTRTDAKFDELFRTFSPTSFLNNPFYQEHDNNHENFFNNNHQLNTSNEHHH